ncbi:unnamed protein product [Pleuronectes platessa]|uniref:Uncharacterized protein n=1 Tax=Pleuronectes platessa TaxID=8262 RepID=A0A9N7VAY3_PLEPL|nr:unnamed protein product [Pleuronectes platessa]
MESTRTQRPSREYIKGLEAHLGLSSCIETTQETTQASLTVWTQPHSLAAAQSELHVALNCRSRLKLPIENQKALHRIVKPAQRFIGVKLLDLEERYRTL